MEFEAEKIKEMADRHDGFVDEASLLIAAILSAYFHKQIKRAIGGITEYNRPTGAWEGVDAFRETEQLKTIMLKPLTEITSASVVDTVAGITPGFERNEKPIAQYRRMVSEGYQLPREVRVAIRGRVDDHLAAPYWGEISTATFDVAQSSVEQIQKKDGSSLEKAVEEIKKKLNDSVEDRSTRTAETEANDAINSGVEETGRVLEPLGIVESKTWITMLDERVRKFHAAKHGETIPVDQMWLLGDSYLCPHPGHHSLPIFLRIHCRCFQTLSIAASEINPIPEALRITI